MTSPHTSKDARTPASLTPATGELALHSETIDLTGARLPSFNDVSTVSLTALTKAAELLWPGELRGEILERIGDIQKGRLRSPSGVTNADAFVALYSMPDIAREELLQKFLTGNERHKWPVAGYSLIGRSSPEERALYPDRSLGNSLSLLERGVLPVEEVAPHIRALGLSLHDASFDRVKTVLPVATGVAVATVGTIAPLWTTVAAGVAGVATCAWFSKRLSLRSEFAAGLQMENLDAYRMISHAEANPVGASLNALFNNPRIAENYGNLIRADAFVIARTLRVFGRSTDDIHAMFRDSTTSYSSGELLDGEVARSLESHGITAPSMLVVPFTEDSINQGLDEDARNLIEALNQVHFEWAIHEKGFIREEFAAAVLDAQS